MSLINVVSKEHVDVFHAYVKDDNAMTKIEKLRMFAFATNEVTKAGELFKVAQENKTSLRVGAVLSITFGILLIALTVAAAVGLFFLFPAGPLALIITKIIASVILGGLLVLTGLVCIRSGVNAWGELDRLQKNFGLAKTYAQAIPHGFSEELRTVLQRLERKKPEDFEEDMKFASMRYEIDKFLAAISTL
ncbi:MAG: hypothetical protein A3F09_03280 [Chlamydiae bacterium RIFCSPHIGHO2_12_FULL_49_11]|nr:MAG: hypothetical protein A3F09_03280 [Chlamydiae bacterium RIFCSPHIGHO2_12_FULL_49_11]